MRFELLKVLLVDDNHHMRILLAEILRAIGVRDIFEAGDGDQAMHILRTYRIDLTMTDLSMPPLDGIEFVRAIRRSEGAAFQRCPVIMITGHSTLQRVNEARDAGVDEFLAKPLNARSVLSRLAQVIDNPRPYVRGGGYFGPERRRRADPNFVGPCRRTHDAVERAEIEI